MSGVEKKTRISAASGRSIQVGFAATVINDDLHASPSRRERAQQGAIVVPQGPVRMPPSSPSEKEPGQNLGGEEKEPDEARR